MRSRSLLCSRTGAGIQRAQAALYRSAEARLIRPISGADTRP